MKLQEIAVSFDHLDLIASQAVEGFITGMHKSPFHGFSVEFAEHRLYNTGESTKNIDWKLFGRTDKLFVKRFDEETNLRCHLLLDVSPSMYYPEGSTKLKFAAVAAAVLANLMKRQRDAFGLTSFGHEIYETLPVRSSVSHYSEVINSLQNRLQSPPIKGSTLVAETLDLIAEKIHRRGLVVILSDMFDQAQDQKEVFNALQHLRFKKHEVIVFHIVDGQTELNFDFDNRPYKFVDPETEQEIKLYPDDVRESYLQNMNNYLKELKLKCHQYNIDYVQADVRKDFNQILLPFFSKRKKLR